jgi:hypothetical protein
MQRRSRRRLAVADKETRSRRPWTTSVRTSISGALAPAWCAVELGEHHAHWLAIWIGGAVSAVRSQVRAAVGPVGHRMCEQPTHRRLVMVGGGHRRAGRSDRAGGYRARVSPVDRGSAERWLRPRGAVKWRCNPTCLWNGESISVSWRRLSVANMRPNGTLKGVAA